MNTGIHLLAAACAIVCMTPAMAQVASPTSSIAGEPYNINVTAYPGPGQAALTWTAAAAPAASFGVERRVLGSRAWVRVGLVAGTARQFIDAGLQPLTSYEYRVVAFAAPSAAGQASLGQTIFTTASASATVADFNAAARPRRLDVQPVSANDIMLTWQDASFDETGFKIERRDVDGTWRALAMTAPNVTVYRDRQLSASTSYTYRISAERPSAATAPGEARSASTPGVTPTMYFVDAVNGNNSNPGTEARPWLTLQKAHGVLQPGQTVLVRAGTYTSTTNYTVLGINRSGAPGLPITYRNFPGERPLIRTTKGINHHGIEVRDAAWLVIDGFEVEGHVNQITPTEAKEQNELALAYSKMTPPKYIGAIVDSNGISIAGKTVNKTHHIVVRNNIVHDTPGGGIGGGLLDYVTIDNNRVYHTSKYSPYGTSGISYLAPYNLDSNTTDYKLQVTNNIVSEASNLYPCNCFSFKQPTDGNGIIIDSFNKLLYTGRTLVANNIVFNNGGRGIHTLNSNYVDVLNNTAVRNGTIAITGEGEVTVQKSRFVRVYNNILVARADRPVNSTYLSPVDVDFSYNIVFGGISFTAPPGSSGNRLSTDPLFAGGVGSGVFRLQGNSPAVNTAFNGVPVPANDVFGAPRPRGVHNDVGAVESY